jgi:hypothetical protein
MTLDGLFDPVSGSDRSIRAVWPLFAIGARARQIDGRRVPGRSANVGQPGVS